MRNCLLLIAGTLVLSALSALATPTSSCNSTTFVCDIYENQTVSFGFLAVSGDVIVQNSLSQTVDVFRIFNDVFDSGGGTGIGDGGFLFGSNQLPNPSTYSVNAVTIPLGPAVGKYFETTFMANGDTYNLFTTTPEPPSLVSLAIATIMATGSLSRRYAATRRR